MLIAFSPLDQRGDPTLPDLGFRRLPMVRAAAGQIGVTAAAAGSGIVGKFSKT
jgi:hypothetical protein